MATRIESPQFRKALEHIEGLMRRRGARLPRIPEMARQAGVSYVTLWKAVHALKLSGRLDVAQGRGIHVATAAQRVPDRTEKPATALTRVEALRRQVEGDILSGVYAAGAALPLPKELRRRYGASHRTLIKALASSDLVQRHKRGYRVPSVSVGARANRVIAIAVGNSAGSIEPFSSRSIDLVRALEHECLAGGIALSVVGYDFRSAVLRPAGVVEQLRSDRRFRDSVLGAAVFLVGIPPERIDEILRLFASLDKPAALLDEVGETWLPSFIPAGGTTRLFSISNSPRPGAHMGRYLLDRGHRHGVYLSPHHDSLWSRNRFAGLSETFALAGGRVEAVTAGTVPEATGEASGIAHSAVRDLAGRLRLPRRVAGRAQERMGNHVDAVARDLRLHAAMAPLVREALSLCGASVFIGANDETALACISLLTERGIRVPRDMSAAGFDDSIEAFAQQLTTYNFNTHEAVRAMLNHILHPARASLTDRKPAVEIPGTIVERGSVRYGSAK